jgi:hypothetical protein|tara:strand:+ start:181 stop:303 length:123 start_codon:yes stop_codon:yes gene_type:complete
MGKSKIINVSSMVVPRLIANNNKMKKKELPKRPSTMLLIK